MMELPEGINYRGIHCYRSKDDPYTFMYIPGNPTPEKDPLGRPTLALSVTDQGAILQFGTRWEANPDLLEELRVHLAEQFEELEPVLIRLQPAPVSVERVTLSLGDGRGGAEELKTERSSGFYPFATVFNVRLAAEQKARAVAALNGRQDFLIVSYELSFPVEVHVKISITGDVKQDIIELTEDISRTDCLDRIEAALAEDRLVLDRTGTTGSPDDLWEKAERLAKDKAAELLLEMTRGVDSDLNESTLEASASLNETIPLFFKRHTDISTWFQGGVGADHIKVLTTTVPGRDGRASDTDEKTIVRLGFDIKDAPVAFIQVICDGTKITVRSPGFEPVALPAAKPVESLYLKTNYTIGGPPFESRLSSPKPEGWVIAPQDLGLVLVSVDGRARQETGARKARVRVRYCPLDMGTEDDRTIHLRGDHWTESWYVVTRSDNLNGSLEWEWKETTADGSVIKHPLAKTDEPELKL